MCVCVCPGGQTLQEQYDLNLERQMGLCKENCKGEAHEQNEGSRVLRNQIGECVEKSGQGASGTEGHREESFGVGSTEIIG